MKNIGWLALLIALFAPAALPALSEDKDEDDGQFELPSDGLGEPVNCTQVQDYIYCDDGISYQRIDNIVYDNNGNFWTGVQNHIYSSDGTHYEWTDYDPISVSTIERNVLRRVGRLLYGPRGGGAERAAGETTDCYGDGEITICGQQVNTQEY